MNHTPQIDQGILPLVTAMNSNDWIETLSSCEGHPESEHHKKPYVSFWCRSDDIPKVCQILNEIESTYEEISVVFDLGIIHETILDHHQQDDRKGWLLLHLKFMSKTEDIKRQTIEQLTDQFKLMKEVRS